MRRPRLVQRALLAPWRDKPLLHACTPAVPAAGAKKAHGGQLRRFKLRWADAPMNDGLLFDGALTMKPSLALSRDVNVRHGSDSVTWQASTVLIYRLI